MKYKITYVTLILALAVMSCEESFIDRASLDGTTVTNYYNTADEVRAATSTLYSGLAWTGYESRALDAIGEVMAGNERSGGTDDPPFQQLTISATSVRLQDAWKAFYKINGWTSALIATFEQKKAEGGDPAILDPAIAECHFMRGTAYFFIARIWGDAPIITDPGAIALSGDFNIPRYYKEDVLRFALGELRKAERGLPETDVPGRVTTYSAKGMMAKLYLYKQDYDSARIKALEVIQSEQYDLFPDYRAMFNSSEHNNNIESMFAVQHQPTMNPWGSGNQMNPDRGPSNLQTPEASMWDLYRPTLDILAEYEPNDLRRTGSVMEHGWTMPQWKPQKSPQDDGTYTENDLAYNEFMADGYRYDTIQPTNRGGYLNEVRANIAKYVVGPGASYGGETVIGMNTGINFMVLRFADILLIYAEAVLADNASTSDASALNAFNRVRIRANLLPKDVLTKEDILHERRVEFAFEGDYWFDIQRQGFAKAKEIIESQDRGSLGNSPVWHVPVYITNFTESMMHLPIPAGETVQDPLLLEPPVPYYETK
ncbi:MAG TPA: RagB/SusD family nutrient uptake outer membrane protein [Bacteroidetes bacterium]|nr:RagB/SusD family nutrient uptake outer membrane protein [Bacteroidota bacterium]